MTTSIFATSATPADEVSYLVENVNELCDADGIFQQGNLPEGKVTIKYGRSWLIVRRAWIEANQPGLIVKHKTKEKAAMKKFGMDYDENRHLWGPIVENLRDQELCSWGEIAVRCGMAESKVRASYKALGAKKDVGLRIGKGGRFAYGDPELYLEHRQAEGAQIPADLKVRPNVDDLLNAKNKDGKLVKLTRAS